MVYDYLYILHQLNSYSVCIQILRDLFFADFVITWLFVILMKRKGIIWNQKHL